MLADVDERIDTIDRAQPGIERQITVWRYQIRVVIIGCQIDIEAAGGLRADEHIAKAQTGDLKPAGLILRIGRGRAPALDHRALGRFRQLGEPGLVIGQRDALVRRLGIVGARVVGQRGQQTRHQCPGISGQCAGGIAGILQAGKQVQRGCRRIQTHAVADPPVRAGVVGQYQRDTLVGVGHVLQPGPGMGQISHGGRTFGQQRMAHHIDLAGRAAIRLGLEPDRAGHDTPVQFGQHDIHGQIPRA